MAKRKRYGSIKRKRKLLNLGRKVRRFNVKISVGRAAAWQKGSDREFAIAGSYGASACIPKEIGRREVHAPKCGQGMGKTPTAAIKKAIHNLEGKLS